MYLSLFGLLLTGLIVGATVTSVVLFTTKNDESKKKINLSTIYNDLTPENKEISKSFNYSVFAVPENIIESYNKLRKSFDLNNFNAFVELLSNDYNYIYENIAIKKLDRIDSSLYFSSSPDELKEDSKSLKLIIKDEYEHSLNFNINFLFNQSIDEFINTDNISNYKDTTIKQEEKEEDIGNNKQEKINVTTFSTIFIAKEFSSDLVKNTNSIKSSNDFTVNKYNTFVESLPNIIFNKIKEKTIIKTIENPEPDDNYKFVLLNDADFSFESDTLSFSILNKNAYTMLVVNIQKISDSISLLTNITNNEDIKCKIKKDLNNDPSESAISIINFDVDNKGNIDPINNIDDFLGSESVKEQLGLNDYFDKNDYITSDSGSAITIATNDGKKLIININNSPTDEDKIKDSSTSMTDNKEHINQILEDIKNNKNETTINLTYVTKALSEAFINSYNSLRIKDSSYNDLISSVKSNEPRLYGLIQQKNSLKNTIFTIDNPTNITSSSTELNFHYNTTVNTKEHTTKYMLTIKKDSNDFMDNTSNNEQNKPTVESNKVPNKENEYKKEVNFVLDFIPSKIFLFYNNYKNLKRESTLINLLKELNTISEIKKEIDFNTNIEGLYLSTDVILRSDLKNDSNKIELEFNFKDTNSTSKITYLLNRLNSNNQESADLKALKDLFAPGSDLTKTMTLASLPYSDFNETALSQPTFEIIVDVSCNSELIWVSTIASSSFTDIEVSYVKATNKLILKKGTETLEIALDEPADLTALKNLFAPDSDLTKIMTWADFPASDIALAPLTPTTFYDIAGNVSVDSELGWSDTITLTNFDNINAEVAYFKATNILILKKGTETLKIKLQSADLKILKDLFAPGSDLTKTMTLASLPASDFNETTLTQPIFEIITKLSPVSELNWVSTIALSSFTSFQVPVEVSYDKATQKLILKKGTENLEITLAV